MCIRDSYEIDEALKRIVAFDAAGADCLYVPIPKTQDDLKRVIAATNKPVNVLVAGPYAKLSFQDYAGMGAARLSLGSALANAVQRTIFDAGTAMFDGGDFSPLLNGISGRKIEALLNGTFEK